MLVFTYMYLVPHIFSVLQQAGVRISHDYTYGAPSSGNENENIVDPAKPQKLAHRFASPHPMRLVSVTLTGLEVAEQ